MLTPSRILALFLAATSFQAATPKPAQVAPPTSTTTPSTTTYHSEAMHFDFMYPSTFANANGIVDDALKKEQDKATGAEKAAMSCVSVPITAMDLTKGLNMIMLMRLDGACLGEETTAAELGAATTAILGESLKQFGKPTMSSSTDYDIAGHSASTVSASVQAEDLGIIHAVASCVISGTNLACFEFASSDCPNLAVIAASSVKFDGAAATPVIPDRLTPTCKQ